MKRTPLTLPAADGRGVVVVVCRKFRSDTLTLNHKDEAALRSALDSLLTDPQAAEADAVAVEWARSNQP